MPVITPTVGRVVYFIPAENCYAFGYYLSKGKPLAALVTEVHSDRLVNLAVFDSCGKSFGKTSVTLRQAEDAVPGGEYCEWMPYQISKAAEGKNNSESAEPRPK